jgi:hypothetical protein
MDDKELRELQNTEIRRREGLEDATCADPTCDGFRCNKRYHLMANLGSMILVQDLDGEKAASLEPPPPGDTAKRCLPNCPECTGAEQAAVPAAEPATKAAEFRKQIRATDLGENGDALLTMRDGSVVRVHDLRRDGVALRPKDTPVTVHAHECWDKVPEEALPQAFYGSSPLGQTDCRCRKKA